MSESFDSFYLIDKSCVLLSTFRLLKQTKQFTLQPFRNHHYYHTHHHHHRNRLHRQNHRNHHRVRARNRNHRRRNSRCRPDSSTVTAIDVRQLRYEIDQSPQKRNRNIKFRLSRDKPPSLMITYGVREGNIERTIFFIVTNDKSRLTPTRFFGNNVGAFVSKIGHRHRDTTIERELNTAEYRYRIFGILPFLKQIMIITKN